MVMIEFREALIDKVYEHLEKSKKHNKKSKMHLCELEEALHEAFEEIMEDEVEDKYEGEENEIETLPLLPEEDYETEINYRGRRGSRMGMRSAMRSNRRNMHLRRNRLGRYAY